MNKATKTLPVVFVVLGFVAVLALIMGFGRFYEPYYGHMGGGMMTMGFIGMLLFWGLVIFLLVSVFKESPSTQQHRGHSYNQSDLPENILERRYAKGEISRDEYREMMNTIRRGE